MHPGHTSHDDRWHMLSGSCDCQARLCLFQRWCDSALLWSHAVVHFSSNSLRSASFTDQRPAKCDDARQTMKSGNTVRFWRVKTTRTAEIRQEKSRQTELEAMALLYLCINRAQSAFSCAVDHSKISHIHKKWIMTRQLCNYCTMNSFIKSIPEPINIIFIPKDRVRILWTFSHKGHDDLGLFCHGAIKSLLFIRQIYSDGKRTCYRRDDETFQISQVTS